MWVVPVEEGAVPLLIAPVWPAPSLRQAPIMLDASRVTYNSPVMSPGPPHIHLLPRTHGSQHVLSSQLRFIIKSSEDTQLNPKEG